MVNTKNEMKNKVNITMLGTFSISYNGTTLTDEINRSQKLWGVMAYLLVNKDRFVPAMELIDVFWSNENRTNPQSALKTLIFRLRGILETIFGAEASPIISNRGSYSWDKSFECVTDIDEFEKACKGATKEGITDEEKMEFYEKATFLYKGDFIPKISDQQWTVPITSHYHLLYLRAVKEYANILMSMEQYGKCVTLCLAANRVEALDEEIYMIIIKALHCQGNESGALAHYEMATEYLYRNLGVKPSKALRSLYTEIMKQTKNIETDLDVIQGDLRETVARQGAFLCDYGFFREAYRLEARRAVRNGNCVHIALLTITGKKEKGELSLDTLSEVATKVQNILVEKLRRGDVVSKYSGAQFVIMLPSANYENSMEIMGRMLTAFDDQYGNKQVTLTYKVRGIAVDI